MKIWADGQEHDTGIPLELVVCDRYDNIELRKLSKIENYLVADIELCWYQPYCPCNAHQRSLCNQLFNDEPGCLYSPTRSWANFLKAREAYQARIKSD